MMSDGNFRQQIPQQPMFQHQQLLSGVPTQKPMTMQGQSPYPPSTIQQPSSFVSNMAPQLSAPTMVSASSNISVATGQPTVGQSSSAGQSTDNAAFHPLTRARSLMADLKQALQAVMKAAADATKEEALKDSATSSNDAQLVASPESNALSAMDELRRSVQYFDSICDQVESNFMVMQDLHREQMVSDKYTPVNVSPSGQKCEDPSQIGLPNRPVLTYKEYEELVSIQSQFTDSVRRSFGECSRLLEWK